MRPRAVLAAAIGAKAALCAFLLLAGPWVAFNSRWIGLDKYPFDRPASRVERALSYYDGSYYLEIADVGYARVAERQGTARAYAFFPLFPLVVRAGRLLTGALLPLSAVAALVNLAASLVSALLLDALFRRDAPERIAWHGVVYFLIFPAAVFYTALYAEPLFLGLSLACFLFAGRQRWWWAGAAGCLAALTRPQGVLLALPLAIELGTALRTRTIHPPGGRATRPRDALAVLLVPAGLLAYATFTAIDAGRFALFLDAQAIWGRAAPSLTGLASVLVGQTARFASLPLHDFQSSQIDLGLTIVFVALLPWIARRQRPSHLIYACALILLPLSTGTTTSMLRSLSLSFPHFLELGRIGARSRIANAAIVALFVPLLAFVGLRLVSWHWAG